MPPLEMIGETLDVNGTPDDPLAGSVSCALRADPLWHVCQSSVSRSVWTREVRSGVDEA